MRKLKIVFVVLLLIAPFIMMAQTRYGSCRGGSASRFYITPYIGAGIGGYSYELNNTVIGPDSTIYPLEKGTMFTPIVGINLLYKVGNSNIGGGAELQMMYGKTYTDITETKQSAYFYKFYARYEHKIYTDAFSDIGFYFQGGVLFPKNIVGNSNSLGGFFLGGIFYNLIIDSKSALFIAADYEYTMFTSTIGGSISNHKLKPIKLSAGYRFWF